MSTSDTPSNFQKFKILLWKNVKQQLNHKYDILQMLINGIGFIAFVLLGRYFTPVQISEEKRYTPYDIDNLPTQIASLNLKVLYTPQNKIYEEIVSGTVQSLHISGFMSCKDEGEFEKELLKNDYLVGINFLYGTESYPQKFAFELRFPAKIRSNSNLNWHTDKLTPNLLGEAYFQEGFVHLQHALVLSYLKRDGKSKNLPKLIYKRFPEAAGTRNFFPFFPLLLIFVNYAVLTYTVAYIAQERITQMKEIMVLNGFQNWLHWLAWFVKTLLLMVIAACIIVLMTKIEFFKSGAIFVKSSATAILFLFIISSIPEIFLSFLLSLFLKTEFYIDMIMTSIVILAFCLTYVFKSLLLNIASCLIPYVALVHSIKYVIMLEEHNIGLQWSDFYKTYDTSMVSPLTCLIMFFVDSIVYCLICLYLEQLHPGEYGIPKKWNFPFQRSFWRGNKRNDNGERSPGGASQDQTQRTSKNGSVNDDSVGVRVKHLTKKFGDHAAVNDLSFNINFNEITVLLGKNGAGKSTFILTLTGLLPPTSGTAFVKNYDIRYELASARKFLSICPQNDAIFNDLYVKDNIKFFCQARGIRDSKIIKAEIKKYTEIMELGEKKNTLAKNLSGGMKRKLSLCCALCGCSSKIVLCDEPSSGVDPAARRHLWTLLQAEKKGKAILLTTHFLDEAEALADRIVIIKEGHAKFDGTIFDMKKNFGQGYCLVCDMRDGCVTEEVTQFLKKHISNIYLEVVRGSVITYRLPPGDTSKYGSLFRDLENNMDRLRLTGFGVSISTVEDVFTQIASGKEGVSARTSVPLINSWRNFNVFSDRLLIEKWRSRKLQQIKGLFIKRKLMIQRKWYILLVLIILPAIIFLGVSLVWESVHNETGKLPPLPIDIRRYNEGIVVLEKSKDAAENSDETRLSNAYEAYSTSFGISYISENKPFEEFILDYIQENSGYQSTKNILVGGTIASGNVTAWFNLIPMHAAPLTLNFLHNAMARTYVDPKAVVEVTNAPLPFKIEKSSNNIEFIIFIMSFFIAFVSLFFIAMPIRERINGTKHQQLLSGLGISSYWLINLVLDFVIFWLILVCILLAYTFLAHLGIYSFLAHLAIFTLFTFPTLLFIYILSLISPDGGIGFTIGFYSFLIMIYIGKFTYAFNKPNLLPLLVLPFVSFTNALYGLASNDALRDFCNDMKEQKGYTCSVIPICCELEDYFSLKNPGVGRELIGILLSIILFVLILLFMELPIKSFIIDSLLQFIYKPTSKKQPMDDDVAMEKERIQNLSKDEREKLPLVVDSISKQYCSFHAVRQVSFRVTHLDCFGLLGINGAGKTTTFKMLTGEAWITSGSAHLYGRSIRTLMRKPSFRIGYCPQQDVLFDELTGRENLRIYCLLRGVRTSLIRRLSNVLALKFEFAEHMHKRAKNLSGGNKRKLCTAIALLGNPQAVYLDEPSSGMDPVVQRQIWSIIADLRETGKPIILTSHNMEECEALCTRLAIMVKGVFRCLGSTQHLKSKFSKNFILKINVKTKQDNNGETSVRRSTDNARENLTSQDVKNIIKQSLFDEYPTAKLMEEYETLLNIQIPIEATKWSEIFEFMELNRNKMYIDDYTISQVSLDDIFIGFSDNL